MQKALVEAKKAYRKQEVPIGAVLVLNNRIIARGHNQTESKTDSTQHAEIICLQKASRKLKGWRLLQTTLYSTLEPCSMCAGALLQARVTRLVWGAPDKRCGANGSFVNLFSLKHPFHQITITSGILEKECSEIMIDFFKQRRKERDGKCF